MVWPDPYFSPIYDQRMFKNYVTSEYEESQRKKTDEVYRMSEFNLLHIGSGLRLTLTEHESYDGETVTYNVIRMFIITLKGKELEVLDANFKDEIFYTSDLEIPFSQTDKSIEIEIKDYFALNYPKVQEKEIVFENIFNKCNKVYVHILWETSPLPNTWKPLWTLEAITGFFTPSKFFKQLIERETNKKVYYTPYGVDVNVKPIDVELKKSGGLTKLADSVE